MSKRNVLYFLLVMAVILTATSIPIKSQYLGLGLFVGRNVNLAPYPIIDDVTGYPVVNSGDPYLQRQNEPSMAVSTRNPMHLLAATNDYRTVYLPFSEGPLPGIELAAQASGDAWVGIFKSYNGGQSWTTHLLPGYPQDDTAIGGASPLHVYEAACDPTVRAGSSGLFFVSGIGFDRIESGSGIFVARYIDNNTQAIGEMDSIEYIDVTMIDEETSGRFADKPWIAVTAPNDSSDTVQIQTSHGPQEIPRFDVYIVYSIFLGSDTSGGGSQIMFAKSSDCGNTWGKPIKLSESVHVCQGTNVVVSPLDGTIYVVWRQYAREQQGVPDAIVMCTSTNSGGSFTKATVFQEINPYDQFTASNRFRTSAFPAIAVDHNGLVYVAWSQLEVEGAPADVPRIVIKTMNGKKFSDPEPIDNHSGRGHQIMPSLSYAGGVLTATWYDTRNSPLNMFPEISGEDQTMDVRAAQANPSNSNGPPANPVFSNSVQVSRYLYYAKTNFDGDLVGENGLLVDEFNPPVIIQANSDRPNLPIFDGGSSPFMGDYLDSAPSPMFLRDYGTGEWRFNTGEGPFDPTLCHIVFACNRDVVPPTGGLTWLSYQPPGTPGCLDDLTTGMRDQNVYTAPITQGIQVYCPVNTKPLSLERSSFLVFVRNLTDSPKNIRLTIDAPLDMNVSFWEFEPPQEQETSEECPYPFDCAERIVEMPVLAHSSITLTVFVRAPYSPSDTTFRVNVEEIDNIGDPTGLKSAILLNPDPVNTNLIDPAQVLEYDAPFVITEDIFPWDFDDVILFSDEFVFTDDVLAELLEASNPDVLAPTRRHPTRRHDAILNPTRRHSSVYSGPDGQVTDINWTIENTGTTTAAYSFDLLGETPSVPYQLLIYRVSSTPMSDGCDLSAEEHHELLLSFEDPSPLSPTRRHEDLQNPTRRHNTFFLAPGETAICTLTLIDPQNPHPFDPEFYANTVTGAFIPQAANENDVIEAAAFMWIYTTTLPDGSVNDTYPDTDLEAEGGEGSYTWSMVDGYGDLPPGLNLDPDGRIWGTPSYDEPYDENNEKTYNFAVQATDSEGQTAYRSLSIKVICKKHKITVTAGEGGSILPSGFPLGYVEVVNGINQTFDIVPDYCYEIEDVVVDGISQGDLTSHAFIGVRGPHTISATFKKITYTITATAGDNGTISPSGNVPVLCGESQSFTITPNSCYTVADVIVDGNSVGAVTSYTFDNVLENHTIHATFTLLTYTITATTGEGGSIEPEGEVSVNCGENRTFTITSDEGYQLVEVLVDGEPVIGITKSAETTYTFYYVQDDHTIEARFQALYAWDARYNNDDVNGNDEANDIATDLSGNSYVTGSSIGRTTGADFYTISYDGDGNVRLSGRLDGPAHDGDYANAIAVDADGNVYGTGYSFRGMAGSKHKDYLTAKYNSSGELEWDVRYDARRNGHDVATDIVVDSSGYVYITGRSENSESKQSDVLHFDFYTIKYSANKGRVVWSQRYNNEYMNGADEATGIAVDTAGNVYVTGRSEGNGTGFDYLTIKYDKNGNLKWASRYNNGGVDEATGIAVDAVGNVYVTGISQGNGTGVDCATVMYDTDGNEIWALRYDGEEGADEAVAIAVDGAGNAYVTGKSQRTGTGFDYVIIKYDASGAQLWDKSYHGGFGADEAANIAIDVDGDVYITGTSQANGAGLDYLTVKYDSSGNLIWRARYNNVGDDIATAIAVDTAGNVYVTGKSIGSDTGFDFATVKYKQHIEQNTP